MDDTLHIFFLNSSLYPLYLSDFESKTNGRFFVGNVSVNARTDYVIPLLFASGEFDFFHGIYFLINMPNGTAQRGDVILALV